MNIQRLEKIAQWLEAGALHTEGPGFHMNSWLEPNSVDCMGNMCDTVMCIGGAAEQLFGDDVEWPPLQYPSTIKEYRIVMAATILELDIDIASQLVYPTMTTYDDVEVGDATFTVRNLMETGEVVWNL